MSDALFPLGLPGLDIKVERETVYATSIHTSQSGKEQRASYQSTPRYRYTLTLNMLRSGVAAPAPNQAHDEPGVLQAFVDQHRGQWDSFLFDDPYDGVRRRVRLASDSLTLERLADGMWAVKKVVLISVK